MPKRLSPEESRLDQAGVYLIRNKLDSRCYVGQSSNLRRRIYGQEFGNPRRGLCFNYLQKAMLEWGVDNFEVEILAIEPDKEARLRLEREWIKKLDTKMPNGYNIK